MPKLILLFVVLIFFAEKTFSQKDSINFSDSKGWKQGRWVKKYEDGKLKYCGQFKDNKPQGEFKYYYEKTGNLKSVINYSQNGVHASAKHFHVDGKTIRGNGVYTNEKKDSVWKYYDEYSALLKEEHYTDTIPDGVWKTYYYSTGFPSEVISFNKNVLVGSWKQYFEDGKIKLEANYINGKLEGTYKVYYIDGKTKIIGNYKNSLKEGKWTFYKSDGTIEKIENYKKGNLQETLEDKEKRWKKLNDMIDNKLPESPTQLDKDEITPDKK